VRGNTGKPESLKVKLQVKKLRLAPEETTFLELYTPSPMETRIAAGAHVAL
jgi:hypothetical protein